MAKPPKRGNYGYEKFPTSIHILDRTKTHDTIMCPAHSGVCIKLYNHWGSINLPSHKRHISFVMEWTMNVHWFPSFIKIHNDDMERINAVIYYYVVGNKIIGQM
jgi:hypothetical protein